MTVSKSFLKFVASEDGAVIVDWVVLTAGIVALGIAVLMSVSIGAVDLGDKTSVAIEDTTMIDHSS